MDQIEAFIIITIQGDSALQTLLGTPPGGGIYPAVPDQEEIFPCIVYDQVDGRENTIPAGTQQSLYQLRIYSKVQSDPKKIATRLKTLFNKAAETDPTIYWAIKVNELGANESSNGRRLFAKILRIQFWSKLP